MKKIKFLLLCSIFISFTACQEDYPELEEGLYAEFKTNKGTFVAELHEEATPATVANFVALAEGTNPVIDSLSTEKGFYDGLTFHRVIKDFMIQGGDPTGTGGGSPGYEFPDEIVDSLQFDSKGILAMANSGPDTNGSQFFITLKETPWLNGRHTIFGEIVKGQEIVDQLGLVETDAADKPVEEIVIQEVNIIRKGDEAENFKANEVFDSELKEIEVAEAKAEEEKQKMMAENAGRFEELKPEAEELESGLQMHYLKNTDGEKPEAGSKVLVYYAGYLPNGELFDTNIEELANEYGILNQRRKDMGGYGPMPVLYSPEARMIAGFREGILEMNVGDKAVLFIPSHLGYGERGFPPVIGPNQDLIFEVEVVGVQEEGQQQEQAQAQQ